MSNELDLISACRNGEIEKIKELLLDPTLDVNFAKSGEATALYEASIKNNAEIVKILLADRRIDINHSNKWGRTVFTMCFESMTKEIAQIFLMDSRLNVEKEIPSALGTMLKAQADYGNTDPEQLILLLAANLIDLRTLCHSHYDLILAPYLNQNVTQQNIFRFLLAAYLVDETEPANTYNKLYAAGLELIGNRMSHEEFREIFDSFFNPPLVIASCPNGPVADIPHVIEQIQNARVPFIKNKMKRFAAEIFILITLLNEDSKYLNLVTVPPEDEKRTKMVRFFTIAKQLPLDLQIVLSNRALEHGGDTMSQDEKDKAIRNTFKSFGR